MGKITCLNCGVKFKGNIETPCPHCDWSVWGYSAEHDDPSFFLEKERTLNGFWMAYKIFGIAAIIVMLILGVSTLVERGTDEYPSSIEGQADYATSGWFLNTFEGVNL